MRSGRYEEASHRFIRHTEVLLQKRIQYEDDKEKVEAIDDDLKVINEYLTELNNKKAIEMLHQGFAGMEWINHPEEWPAEAKGVEDEQGNPIPVIFGKSAFVY